MKENPFTSGTFVNIWLKHFNEGKPGTTFSFIGNLQFVKHRLSNLFTNVGKTNTKGIHYSVFSAKANDLKGKVFLIYDVPAYFNIKYLSLPSQLNLFKIKQYPGFLIRLEDFNDISQYVNATFKSKSRNKLKRDKKRLEKSFDISYSTYYGKISREEYNQIFDSFRNILEKRFDTKGIYNNNLDPEEWAFYQEVAYPMILEKKACLFVTKERNKPICIMLNFLSNDSLFQFMMAFDIDYAKFNIGSTSLMKLIEWCLDKRLRIFDFSKGYYHFKKRLSNLEYRFEYHVLYDTRSLYCTAMAHYLKYYFMLKQALRDLKINELLHKLRFRSTKMTTIHQKRYIFMETSASEKESELKNIDFLNNEHEYPNLKPLVFDFLYYHAESLSDIKIYEFPDDPGRYLIQGENVSKIIQMQ